MNKFLPFKKNAEIFKWGPIPGRYFYVSEFDYAIFVKYLKLYKGPIWPNTIFLFKDKRMVWINDFAELRRAGKETFERYMLKQKVRNKLKKEWRKAVKDLSDFEKKIDSINLEKLSDNKLYDLWQKFHRLIIVFWLPTIPAELGNYGSDKLLEDNLKEFVKNSNEFSSVMEILTTPEKISFYQEEEIDLDKTKNLEQHLKKYFWLRNSYNGAEKLSVEFFLERKKQIKGDIKNSTDERLKGIKNKKRKIILNYKLPKRVIDIANALCKGIEWQDERKKFIFIYIHYKELFLKEVARRFKYDIDSLRNCGLKEIMEILKKKEVRVLIEKRDNLFGFFMNPIKRELIRIEAKFCWNYYLEEKVNEEIKEIKGIIASVGKRKVIEGNAKIVLDPKEKIYFKKGDILVAPMTSPEYIFIMKKAKAVITDDGGLTSHAAIVSRELNIPCIVGTKIATKVLKDGDLVEMDANKGIVKILKKI